jgi:hypothetical protein
MPADSPVSVLEFPFDGAEHPTRPKAVASKKYFFEIESKRETSRD